MNVRERFQLIDKHLQVWGKWLESDKYSDNYKNSTIFNYIGFQRTNGERTGLSEDDYQAAINKLKLTYREKQIAESVLRKGKTKKHVSKVLVMKVSIVSQIIRKVIRQHDINVGNITVQKYAKEKDKYGRKVKLLPGPQSNIKKSSMTRQVARKADRNPIAEAYDGAIAKMADNYGELYREVLVCKYVYRYTNQESAKMCRMSPRTFDHMISSIKHAFDFKQVIKDT